jgi:hypothetical protein
MIYQFDPGKEVKRSKETARCDLSQVTAPI